MLYLLSPSNLIYCFDPLIIDNDIKFLIVSTILRKTNVFIQKKLIYCLNLLLNHQQWYVSVFFSFFIIFLRNKTGFHCEFLEYWNTQKSLWKIWQRFSCLLDEEITKMWKKLNSHDGFLSNLQNSTANSAHLAAHFCPALVCPQKATVRIQFLPYFWNPLIK